MDKVKTYSITVRPLDGITDEQIGQFVKYVKRSCEYYHVITEKTMSARHIHAGLCFKTVKSRSNVVVEILRLFKSLTSQEKAVLRSGIKIWYNIDWLDQYLSKDDDTVVVVSCLPEAGHLESYFPPKPVPVETRDKKCSIYYHELERLWYAHTVPGYEVHTMNARNFLFNVMYNLRVLPVIRDDKQIVQTARHLVRWLNKASSSTIELAPFEREE